MPGTGDEPEKMLSSSKKGGKSRPLIKEAHFLSEGRKPQQTMVGGEAQCSYPRRDVQLPPVKYKTHTHSRHTGGVFMTTFPPSGSREAREGNRGQNYLQQ